MAKRSAKPLTETDVFTSPESSTVEGGVRDAATGDVVLAFRDKKKDGAEVVYYTYSAVEEKDWQSLKDAESKGKYMVTFRRKYRGVKTS